MAKGKIEKEVPRVHVHVYEVKDLMVEVDFVRDMTSVEARETAIAICKQGQNVQPPTKSDSKYIAVSFRQDEKHENERETIIPCPVIHLNVEAIDVEKARKLLKEELGPELVQLLKSNIPVDVKKAKESMIKVMEELKMEEGGKV